MKSTTHGFVSLICVLIACGLVSFMILEISMIIGTYQHDLQNADNKETSFYGARSCMAIAKIRAMDKEYLGDESISMNTVSCEIDPLDQQSLYPISVSSTVRGNQSILHSALSADDDFIEE
jgi:hypothetical protein